jgi:phenylacetate-CoA ligase
MPMIRYRIGDVGRFPAGSRPGHPTFVLRDVLGRNVDRVWLPDGRWIHGIQLPHLMKEYPVYEFRFLQRSDYSVCLEIIPGAGFSAAHGKQIEAMVEANLPGLKVTIVLVDHIPRTKAGKWRPVVSEVILPQKSAT